jgi:hypothetical protein
MGFRSAARLPPGAIAISFESILKNERKRGEPCSRVDFRSHDERLAESNVVDRCFYSPFAAQYSIIPPAPRRSSPMRSASAQTRASARSGE